MLPAEKKKQLDADAAGDLAKLQKERRRQAAADRARPGRSERPPT